jgi:hypothetical protein
MSGVLNIGGLLAGALPPFQHSPGCCLVLTVLQLGSVLSPGVRFAPPLGCIVSSLQDYETLDASITHS